jgi:hypothetical protein
VQSTLTTTLLPSSAQKKEKVMLEILPVALAPIPANFTINLILAIKVIHHRCMSF